MTIRRRLVLLTAISGIGGLLFAPFVSASAQPRASVPSLLNLALILGMGSAAVAALCSWMGLRWSDRADLPMPWLRAWELKSPTPPGALRRMLAPAMVGGVAAGILVAIVVRTLPMPANPGSLAVRLLTVFFAATVTEIVVHLFAMSGLVLLFRKQWTAILLSSTLFVLIFHSGQVGGALTTSVVLLANFIFGTLTGWMYARYGFECAILTHAVAHVIALGWN